MQFSVEADLLAVEISGLCFFSTVYYCLFPWDKFSGNSRWKLSVSCLWFLAGHSSAVPVSLHSFWSCRCLRIFKRLWVNAIKLPVGLSSCRTYDMAITWWFSTRVCIAVSAMDQFLLKQILHEHWTKRSLPLSAYDKSCQIGCNFI